MTDPTRDDPPPWKPPPEFLRELPDLISGKDPELLRPEARAWMLRDPQAREYAQQICGAIAMFADLPSRMASTTVEPISARAKRSVERAARQLPRRLAEVLWPLLTIELDRVAKSNNASVIDPTRAIGELENLERTLAADRDRLLYALTAHSPSRRISRLPILLQSRAVPSATANATSLITARRLLTKNDSACLWAELLLHHVSQDQIPRVSEWVSFVQAHSKLTTNYHAHVLQTAALALEAGHMFNHSIELCSLVTQRFESSATCAAAAYTGLKLSCLRNDRQLQAAFLRSFEQGLRLFPAQHYAWTRQFLLDANAWLTSFQMESGVVKELLFVLGNGQ